MVTWLLNLSPFVIFGNCQWVNTMVLCVFNHRRAQWLELMWSLKQSPLFSCWTLALIRPLSEVSFMSLHFVCVYALCVTAQWSQFSWLLLVAIIIGMVFVCSFLIASTVCPWFNSYLWTRGCVQSLVFVCSWFSVCIRESTAAYTHTHTKSVCISCSFNFTAFTPSPTFQPPDVISAHFPVLCSNLTLSLLHFNAFYHLRHFLPTEYIQLLFSIIHHIHTVLFFLSSLTM